MINSDLLTKDDYADLAARVDRGIKFLDERYPSWREEIDVDDLQMDQATLCVLGQLGGNYWDMLNRIGWGADDAIHHGFYLRFPYGGSDLLEREQYYACFRVLEYFWAAEITHDRQGPRPTV